MKLTIAVLALLCLSSAVSASSNAADFKKLPLAGLLASHLANITGPFAEANITVSGDYFVQPSFHCSQQARSSTTILAPAPQQHHQWSLGQQQQRWWWWWQQ
jgi:hypothetical protein